MGDRILFKESFGIFKRNPWTSTFTILLIIAASLGQVISLSSVYPVLQGLVPDQNTNQTGEVFTRLLAAFGAAATFSNFLLLFLVLSTGYSLLNWASDCFQNLQVRKFEAALREELFEAAVRARWTYARDLRHGEFLSVITREVTRSRELIQYLVQTFAVIAQSCALLAFAIYLNWKVTGLGVLIFCLGGLVLAPILRHASTLGRKGAELYVHMSDRTIAALRSLKMVKALSLETYLAGAMRPSFEAQASNAAHVNMLLSGQYAAMEIIGVLAISTMLYAGLFVLSTPKAALLIVLVVLFRALPYVRLSIENYHRASALFPSLQIVRQHLTAAQKAETRRGGIPVPAYWERIDFNNVRFGYDDRVILNNVSLSIGRGEFWAVVGASGAGKTTLLDLITGLLEPQSGTVRIGAVNLVETDLESWHSQIAYLGQDAFAFSGSVRDNLTWGTNNTDWSDEHLKQALHRARLSADLNRNAGENGSNLSGGERQRLAVARLFLRQPALIILDEPTTGLDTTTETDILDSIFSHYRDTTIIMVTHREELVRDAHHVIRLSDQGTVVDATVRR